MQADAEMVEVVSRALMLWRTMGLANAPKQLTSEMALGWAQVLQASGVPVEDVPPTAVRLLQTETFFPTVARFLAIWRPPEDQATTAELAWQRALKCVRRYGRMASLTEADLDGDRLALQALQAVGWARLCEQLDEENRAIWRAEFIRVYGALRAEGGAGLRYLPGLAERENAARGYQLTPERCGRPDWPELPALAGHSTPELPLASEELPRLADVIGRTLVEGA